MIAAIGMTTPVNPRATAVVGELDLVLGSLSFVGGFRRI